MPPITSSPEHSGCSLSALYTVGTHEMCAELSYLETSITESNGNSRNNSGELYIHMCIYIYIFVFLRAGNIC